MSTLPQLPASSRRRGSGRRAMLAWVKGLSSSVVELAAQLRRKRGYFDYRTLMMFRRAWFRTRSPSSLLHYMVFRRCLGFPLADRWVEALSNGVGSLNLVQQRRALGLLAEINVSVNQWITSLGADADISEFYYKQEEWRKLFARWLQSKSKQGICVVGNAAMLNESGLGEFIERQGLVVRFNHYQSVESAVSDIGEKRDVWVVSPKLNMTAPSDLQWLVMSGPDVRFHLKDWTNVRPLLQAGIQVLTVPLPYWRRLVAELQAPPSSGLLFLLWLREMLGSWEDVSAVGFGVSTAAFPPDDTGRKHPDKFYHHANKSHKAASRHNWFRERMLLQRWQNEGLTIIKPPK